MKYIRKKLASEPKLGNVLTICCLLLIVFTCMCIYSDSYRSVYNITNLIAQCVPLSCVAIGQTIVMISGGIDLSVGSTISVCTAVAAKLLDTSNPAQIGFGVAAVIGVSALIGAMNGYGVAKLNVPPMITTLCTSTALSGVALWILPVAGGGINKAFAKFVYQKWELLSMPLVLMVVLFLIMRHIMYHSRTGVGIYAVGQSRQIASSMGVNSQKARIKAYVLCGICAGVTGLLLACRMRVGDPTCGSVYSMDSITAAAIGGTALSGGVGLISGSIAGAFLVGMLSNVLNILEVNQFYQYIFKGGLLIMAMVIYSISNAVEAKRHEK